MTAPLSNKFECAECGARVRHDGPTDGDVLEYICTGCGNKCRLKSSLLGLRTTRSGLRKR